MYTHVFDIKSAYIGLLRKGQHIYGHLGELSKENFDLILEHVEHVLAVEVSSRKARKKIFNVIIESLQNLHDYICDTCALEGLTDVFVCINKDAHAYHIYTGNFLMRKDFQGVESRIKMVNSLTKDQLRELYRGVLSYGEASESGGAGLGFIDLAKKSEEDLMYRCDKVDEKIAFFTLEIVVGE